MRLLATIVDGETDLADVMFLVALIVFVVATVMRAMVRDVGGALIGAGLAALSLGWLVL